MSATTASVEAAASPMETTTAESACVGTASKTGLPSRGKSSYIAAVVKAAEGAGTCSGLKVRGRTAVESRIAVKPGIPRVASVK